MKCPPVLCWSYVARSDAGLPGKRRCTVLAGQALIGSLTRKAGRCEVDPGRPAGVSAGGFPRVASRTRRASRPGTGLSASPVRGCRGDLSVGWPGCRDGCSPVAVACGAHRGGVEQCDLGCDRPPSAVAVAPLDGLPCDPAVFAPRPPYDPVPGVAGQVSEGGGGHAGPEVRAPASQRRVELADEDLERLVDAAPADGLHFHRHGLDGFAGRIGVDVVPAGASLAVALDAPAEEVEAYRRSRTAPLALIHQI